LAALDGGADVGSFCVRGSSERSDRRSRVTSLPTPSESASEHLRNAEMLLQAWVMELAGSDMTTPEVGALAEVRDRVKAAREIIEEIRALTRGPVSAELATTLYWKVRE